MKAIQRVAATLSLALLAAALPAWAQYGQEPGAGGPPKGHKEGGFRHADPKERAAHLAKKLNLNDEQKTKAEAIYQDEQQQVSKLWENPSLSHEEKHAKMEEIRKSTQSRIKAILTKEQQQKYEEMQERRHEMREKHGQGNKP